MGDSTKLLGRGQDEATLLARTNPHERDGRVTFDEASHVYSVDGRPITTSVTGVLKRVEREPFNAAEVAARLARRPSADYNAGVDAVTGALLPLTPAAILKQWDDNRDLGTLLHGCLERHLNGLVPDPEAVALVQDEYRQGLQWLAQCGMTPFRTEWVIFDEDSDVAGSVDFVGQYPDGSLGIVDWKRCKHGQRGFAAHWRGEHMLAPLDHLPECKLSHWRAQVNLYRVMLERKYGVRVASMCMVAMLPGQATAVQYDHPTDDRVAALLEPSDLHLTWVRWSLSRAAWVAAVLCGTGPGPGPVPLNSGPALKRVAR